MTPFLQYSTLPALVCPAPRDCSCLLRYYSGDPWIHGLRDFEAEFSKHESSFHLKKASVHLSDLAVHFCALGAQCLGLQGELNMNMNTHNSFNCLCTAQFQLQYPLSGFASEVFFLFSKLSNARSWFCRMEETVLLSVRIISEVGIA